MEFDIIDDDDAFDAFDFDLGFGFDRFDDERFLMVIQLLPLLLLLSLPPSGCEVVPFSGLVFFSPPTLSPPLPPRSEGNGIIIFCLEVGDSTPFLVLEKQFVSRPAQ